MLWGISRRFHRLYPGDGHVAHALRTLSPVAASRIATTALPLDLHVLSLPLAFILSQDQTLLCIYTYKILSQIPTAYILPKEINALVLVLGTFACTNLSILSMIFPVHFETGCKDNHFFFLPKLFLEKIFTCTRQQVPDPSRKRVLHRSRCHRIRCIRACVSCRSA